FDARAGRSPGAAHAGAGQPGTQAGRTGAAAGAQAGPVGAVAGTAGGSGRRSRGPAAARRGRGATIRAGVYDPLAGPDGAAPGLIVPDGGTVDLGGDGDAGRAG